MVLTPDQSEAIHSTPWHGPASQFCVSESFWALSHQVPGRRLLLAFSMACFALQMTCRDCSPSPHTLLHWGKKDCDRTQYHIKQAVFFTGDQLKLNQASVYPKWVLILQWTIIQFTPRLGFNSPKTWIVHLAITKTRVFKLTLDQGPASHSGHGIGELQFSTWTGLSALTHLSASTAWWLPLFWTCRQTTILSRVPTPHELEHGPHCSSCQLIK